MEQTECSETSAYKIQTPGIYPKEGIKEFTFDTIKEEKCMLGTQRSAALFCN
jgi:hypothetical protein